MSNSERESGVRERPPCSSPHLTGSAKTGNFLFFLMEENSKRKKESIFLLRFLFQILFFEEPSSKQSAAAADSEIRREECEAYTDKPCREPAFIPVALKLQYTKKQHTIRTHILVFPGERYFVMESK